jgi:hypothetical protein
MLPRARRVFKRAKKTPRERGYSVACLLAVEEQFFWFLSGLRESVMAPVPTLIQILKGESALGCFLPAAKWAVCIYL